MVQNKAWLLKDVGGQLVLEGLQRCLAYCSLRKLVPQDDSSREEALLVGGVRSPDLVEERVVEAETSSHASLWVRLGSNGISTNSCTMGYIMLSLARSQRFCRVSQPRFVIISVTLLVGP